MSAWEQWDEVVAAELVRRAASPVVAEAALLGGSYSDDRFVQAFDHALHQGERVEVVEAKTRVGVVWSHHSFLNHIMDVARKFGGVEPRCDRSSVARLLGEALGVVPSVDRVRELRRRYGNTPLVREPDPPQVFGAYVCAAGLRSPVVDAPSFAALCQSLGGAAVIARSYADRLAVLAGMLEVWRADLLVVIQRWLSPVAYAYVDHAPPLACSPCGVIRMASPEVPRGPELALQLDAPHPSWAPAA
ncbi:hypothetical protein ACFWCB_29100 [Streptomyces sp. NPDC060048]|uniref:hypothetical protein n=1 Tax=unclassified Streptomyces TaxID=2593676 RepID=UPI0036CE42C8